MDILNPQSLREHTLNTLRRGREPKKVIYSYAGATLVISLLVTLLDIWLENQIASTSGLSNLGTRAIFSTAQQAIPMLSSLAAMCLELGFLHGLMRISRGQYADHTDLKMGFRKFWPLLRMSLLLGFVYFGIAFAAFQLSYLVFMLTPWSDPFLDLLQPIVASGGTTLDEATLISATGLMAPMFILFGVAYLAILVPFLYWFRMANFCLLDDPLGGALAALRASRKMMRRRFPAMLKIDLSLWPYYVATILVTLTLYGDLFLPILGVQFPMEARTVSYIFYGVALAIQFAANVFLRGKAEITYLLVYNQLREQPRENSVVLGNIFDM